MTERRLAGSWGWHLAALLVFAGGLGVIFRALWGEDLRAVAPLNRQGGLEVGDLQFVIWLAARNAATLLSRPQSLFQAEPCFPAESSLALGEPGVTLGATDDLGFNIVEKPVHVHDLQATILHLLGLDHERLTVRYAGRDFRLTDVHGRLVRDILA